MNVLHISKFYPPEIGGIELFAFDLIEQLADKVTCDVLCANTANKTVIEKNNNYTVFRAASFGTIFSTSISPAIISLLKKLGKEYDVIHLHLPNPLANLAYFIVRPDTKLVIHWHSDILKQKKLMLLYKPLQDWLLRRADIIIATSENYLEKSDHLRKHKEKCTVIQLGLNPDRLSVNEDKVIDLKNRFGNQPCIFTLGRLVYYKGLKYLIEAMKDVNAYLLIGGTGPLQEKMQEQIIKLNLTEKVFMVGRIEESNLGAYYQACDVFCLPSIYKTEAFGLVQVEAMFFAKPLISTNIAGSGVSWVNEHNTTGLIVPPQDSDTLAKALTEIISNPEFKKRLGINGKEKFKKHFDITVIAEKIFNVYSKLLQKQSH